MQTKRYATLRESTLAAAGSLPVSIINDSDRRANFHGIRCCGRLRADNVSADGEASGYIVIDCNPAQLGQITEASFDSVGNLEDASGFRVALMPWSVFGGSTNPVGAGTFFDWDIVIKTSRTCSKNDRLQMLLVSFAESSKSVIVANALLSCFETTL